MRWLRKRERMEIKREGMRNVRGKDGEGEGEGETGRGREQKRKQKGRMRTKRGGIQGGDCKCPM